MMEFQMIDETEPLLTPNISVNKSTNVQEDNSNQTSYERNNFDRDDDIKPSKLVKAISMQELGPPYKSIVHISSPQDDSGVYSEPRHELKRSREAEKNRLILNNTRFANIIEKNRHLELANQKLSAEIKSLEDKQRRTVDNFSLRLDDKLQEALEELKETKKVNQSLTLVVDNLKKNVDQLNSELEKSIDLNVHQQRVIASFETKCDNLQSSLNAETSQKNKLQTQIKDMEGEMERLSARLGELINEYEVECLSKVELECKLRGELEEANFRSSVLSTELNEMKSTSAMKFLLIEEKSQKEYDDKLERFLSALREEYERKLVENKGEQETLFSMKESDHIWKSQRLDTELQFKTDELKALESRVEALLVQISKLEGDKVGLERRLETSQSERRAEKERLEQELRSKEEEAEMVRKERAALLDQYRDLMDTKTALDNELASYSALLATEEDRLEIHLEKKPPTDGNNNNNLGKPDILQ